MAKKKIQAKLAEAQVVNSYTEDDVTVIKDDIQRLRKKPGMYIGYLGTSGFLHLTKEVLQNSVDEIVAIKGKGEIWIYYNQKKKTMRIKDNGRGIPISKIADLCMYIQASGKFDKGDNNAYKFSAGMNGVGATATNALSEYFNVCVCRDGKKHVTYFEKGVLISDRDTGKSNETGTDIEFKPDESVLGEVDLDYTMILDLAEVMSHLSKVTIHVHATGIQGKDGDVNKTFKSNGIVDALVDLAGKHMLIDPLYFRKESKDKNIEVAMTYVSDSSSEKVLSFANYCTTVDHGTPLTGVKQALTSVMGDFIRENCMNKKEKDEIKITGDDCMAGWVCVINVNHIDPNFIGQVKEKIQNPDLIGFSKSATVAGLKGWIENHEKEAKKIGNMIKKSAKLRAEGQKIRQNSVAKEANAFTINANKYERATGKDNLELIIIEGLSALGTSSQARFREFQEVYAMRGVPANMYGLKYLNALENEEFNNLVTIMGMGIGPKKNISKARHERYIIMTDADIDGNKITSLLSVFFMVFYPELIEQGRVYKAVAPLYSYKSGNDLKYIQNNKELTKILRKAIIGKHEIVSLKTKKKLKETDLGKLIDLNRQYIRELKSISNKVSVHPFLIEYIMSHSDKNYSQLAKMINKEFKFMDAVATKNQLLVEGVYDRNFQYAVINDKFFTKCKKLKSAINDNIDTYGLKFKIDGEECSLYETLNLFEKFKPTTERFKGLGEMNYEQLRDTTLDPENRNLIRLTSKDVQKDLENFAILHSTSKKSTEARAKLFEKFEIDIDDIDN